MITPYSVFLLSLFYLIARAQTTCDGSAQIFGDQPRLCNCNPGLVTVYSPEGRISACTTRAPNPGDPNPCGTGQFYTLYGSAARCCVCCVGYKVSLAGDSCVKCPGTVVVPFCHLFSEGTPLFVCFLMKGETPYSAPGSITCSSNRSDGLSSGADTCELTSSGECRQSIPILFLHFEC